MCSCILKNIAMSLDELCSLHDMYQLLDADFRAHQTTYILQFMWRDITSDFEVIGPCEKSLEMKFLAACVFEAMYVFETYGFHVFSIVCDGASCNLSLLKRLCGKSGRYGSDINSMSIQKMWERDLRRTNPVMGRQLTSLPGMESYILRDSWTRLNVMSAKIMQV